MKSIKGGKTKKVCVMKTIKTKSKKTSRCKKSSKGKCLGVKRKTKKRTSKGKSKKKRPVNKFFKIMLHSKRNNIESFEYKGNTYKGKHHPRLGLIYKKI